MNWSARGVSVVRAMGLSHRELEMTLEEYEARRCCGGCGETDVALYDSGDGLVCALCDIKCERKVAS